MRIARSSLLRVSVLALAGALPACPSSAPPPPPPASSAAPPAAPAEAGAAADAAASPAHDDAGALDPALDAARPDAATAPE
ncbi:MAG: hypothetical protein KIS78_33770, partial [Labilithrix sp.]|nr:hypothetical protein [Labilithrix sp.]